MKTTLRAGIGALALVSSCAAAQDQLAFSTAVDLNYKQLLLSSLFVNQTTGVATVNEFRPKLWTLNFSPSLAWHGLFLTLGLERSLGEGSTSSQTSGGYQDRRYSREENNLTAGYDVWRGITVFAGYLDNKTTTNTTQVQGSTATLSTNDLTEKGPYYGLAYAYRFASGASLAASIAATRADGTSTTVNSSNTGTSGSGDVRGNSYGLSWSAPLTGSLFYRLGLKATRYDFKFTDNLGFPRQTKQNYDAFYLGVANYF
jgi:hypothetical protein